MPAPQQAAGEAPRRVVLLLEIEGAPPDNNTGERDIRSVAAARADGGFNHSGDPDELVARYDQQADIAEKTNVAAQHPDIAATLDEYLRQARSDSPDREPNWSAAK